MQWTESVYISQDPAEVFDAIRDQHTLMEWSAWPQATGFTCAVDGDGRSIGSEIVFTSPDGQEQGRQTITAIEDGLVRNRLRNRGPRGTWVEPSVDFRVEPEGDGTRVYLDFDIQPPVPRLLHPIANRYLKRTIRPLHVEDLRRLKQLAEAR